MHIVVGTEMAWSGEACCATHLSAPISGCAERAGQGRVGSLFDDRLSGTGAWLRDVIDNPPA
jgi:hypothetical protein